jgi:hypothetical protein
MVEKGFPYVEEKKLLERDFRANAKSYNNTPSTSIPMYYYLSRDFCPSPVKKNNPFFMPLTHPPNRGNPNYRGNRAQPYYIGATERNPNYRDKKLKAARAQP